MSTTDVTALIHLVGFLSGVVLYGLLGVMTLRSRGGRGDRIPLATAVLGLVWNSGALAVYTFRDFGLGEPQPWIAALAFIALGFLPAVAVHSTIQSLYARRGAPQIVSAAYLLSVAAGGLHVMAAIAGRSVPSRSALIVLTAGYALVIAALALTMRRRAGVQRALSVVGLAAFAVMAFHLTQHAAGTDSWPIELAGHHASLPLALVILYQDYRFALADIFLKRVLTLLVIIAVALVSYVKLAVPHILPLASGDPFDPRATVAMLALWTALVVAYPMIKLGIERMVDGVILRRVDYRALRARIETRTEGLDEPDAVLDAGCEALKPALMATQVQWSEADSATGPATVILRSRGGGQEALVHIPTAESPAYVMEIGALSWGRRLLSDDVAMLEGVALVLARRIDAIRVTRERFERTLREQEMVQLATQAELRALRAQLNPHFLFNALTTIGHLIQEAPPRALDTLYQLTGLLRAVLKRSDREFTTLGEELELVESYLSIERARFEERLGVKVQVATELLSLRLPPFILQPLVENAVKHGIAPRRQGGEIVVAARLVVDAAGEMLWLSVRDAGVGIRADELARRRADGVGLDNVQRRIERHYGSRGSITITSDPGVGTTVDIRIPAARSGRSASTDDAMMEGAIR